MVQRLDAGAGIALTAVAPTSLVTLRCEFPTRAGELRAAGRQVLGFVITSAACFLDIGYSDDDGVTFRDRGTRDRILPASAYLIDIVAIGTHVRLTFTRDTADATLNFVHSMRP